MGERFLFDLAALKAGSKGLVAVMNGLAATSTLFIIASPGVTHTEVVQYLSLESAPVAEIFVSAHETGKLQDISAWKANVAKSLGVVLFVSGDEMTAKTARMLGVPTALFMV